MIPGVPNMGGAELLIILAIILLFFGAKRVPELGRSLGKGIREFRQGTSGAEDDEDGKRRELEDRSEEIPRNEADDHPIQARDQSEQRPPRQEDDYSSTQPRDQREQGSTLRGY